MSSAIGREIRKVDNAVGDLDLGIRRAMDDALSPTADKRVWEKVKSKLHRYSMKLQVLTNRIERISSSLSREDSPEPLYEDQVEELTENVDELSSEVMDNIITVDNLLG